MADVAVQLLSRKVGSGTVVQNLLGNGRTFTQGTMGFGQRYALSSNLVSAQLGSVMAPGSATISWNANTESDLSGYKVYHGTSSGVYFENRNVANVLASVWAIDLGTHYFTVTAYDTSGNESGKSAEVSKTVGGSYNRIVQFSDDFTRADSTDLGANWVTGYTGAPNLQIVNQALELTTVGSRSIQTYATQPSGNQWAQITLKTLNGSIVKRGGLTLRTSNPGAWLGYNIAIHSPSSIIDGLNATTIIQLRDSGVSPVLTRENSTTWGPGDTLTAQAFGSTITVLRNGATLLSVVDTTYVQGLAGVTLYTDPGGSPTDFELDTFSGGDVVIV